MVYYSATGVAGTFKCIGMYPAKTYDSDGNGAISQAFSITNNLQSNTGSGSDAYRPGNVTGIQIKAVSGTSALLLQGVVGNMANDHAPIPSAAGYNAEFAMLIDLDPVQGFGSYRYLDESADERYGFATLRDVTSATPNDAWQWLLYSYG